MAIYSVLYLPYIVLLSQNKFYVIELTAKQIKHFATTHKISIATYYTRMSQISLKKGTIDNLFGNQPLYSLHTLSRTYSLTLNVYKNLIVYFFNVSLYFGKELVYHLYILLYTFWVYITYNL